MQYEIAINFGRSSILSGLVCSLWTPVAATAEDIRASTRENLSSGFPTKRDSNQSPQLQRLARKLKFHLKQVYL